MMGKEIAENLRNSKENWNDGYLLRIDAEGNRSYCVVGLKLHEAGIEDRFLLNQGNIEGFHTLDGLFGLNDSCEQKEELIEKLESDDLRSVDYPIEALVRYIREVIVPRWEEI